MHAGLMAVLQSSYAGTAAAGVGAGEALETEDAVALQTEDATALETEGTP